MHFFTTFTLMYTLIAILIVLTFYYLFFFLLWVESVNQKTKDCFNSQLSSNMLTPEIQTFLPQEHCFLSDNKQHTVLPNQSYFMRPPEVILTIPVFLVIILLSTNETYTRKLHKNLLLFITRQQVSRNSLLLIAFIFYINT